MACAAGRGLDLKPHEDVAGHAGEGSLEVVDGRNRALDLIPYHKRALHLELLLFRGEHAQRDDEGQQ